LRAMGVRASLLPPIVVWIVCTHPSHPSCQRTQDRGDNAGAARALRRDRGSLTFSTGTARGASSTCMAVGRSSSASTSGELDSARVEHPERSKCSSCGACERGCSPADWLGAVSAFFAGVRASFEPPGAPPCPKGICGWGGGESWGESPPVHMCYCRVHTPPSLWRSGRADGQSGWDNHRDMHRVMGAVLLVRHHAWLPRRHQRRPRAGRLGLLRGCGRHVASGACAHGGAGQLGRRPERVVGVHQARSGGLSAAAVDGGFRTAASASPPPPWWVCCPQSSR
jgi:hypothetical protein